MHSFLTQCPHCLMPFRVTETQLEAADGLVRCGACLGIFSATTNRITLKQTPEEAVASAPNYAPVGREASLPEADEEIHEEIVVPVPPDAFRATEADAPEPEPQQDNAAIPAYADEPLLDHPHERDMDIPLGDLDLDADEDFDEEEAYEEDEEEEYEEEDDSDDDDEEYEDEDDEDEFEDVDEEEYDYSEESDDEDGAVTEDDSMVEAANAMAAADKAGIDLPEPPVRRPAYERITTDKTELHRHLAALEDDEALEPLADSTLDSFTDEPVTLVATPRRSRWYTFALFSANLILAAVLVLQYIDANLEDVRRNARLAPLMPYVCRILECPVRARSQLDSLVSEQLLVRSHPRYAQALEVRFVFRNDASAAQPFPALEIGFNDTNNRLLANRLFLPAEYLPRELQTSEMPAQSSLQITLDMIDPGSEAVNYTLAFRAP